MQPHSSMSSTMRHVRGNGTTGASGSFEPIESDSLAAATSPGTGYDRDRALQLIQERYESVCETIRKTLATLRRRAWPRAHHPPAR
jgi:hypothetical protein